MPKPLFSGRHFNELIILQCLRWYLRYPLSYRDLEEIMMERGVEVDHTTIYRWVYNYSPEFEKRISRYKTFTYRSWRLDETYIKVKGQWKYLYRAVDSEGVTLDFMLSHKRDAKAAKCFLRKLLSSYRNVVPKAINTDLNPSYPLAIKELKASNHLPNDLEHRKIKYLNNILESDHFRIKRLIKPMLGFKSFKSASNIIKGLETMLMIKKEQFKEIGKGFMNQINFFNNLFLNIA